MRMNLYLDTLVVNKDNVEKCILVSNNVLQFSLEKDFSLQIHLVKLLLLIPSKQLY